MPPVPMPSPGRMTLDARRGSSSSVAGFWNFAPKSLMAESTNFVLAYVLPLTHSGYQSYWSKPAVCFSLAPSQYSSMVVGMPASSCSCVPLANMKQHEPAESPPIICCFSASTIFLPASAGAMAAARPA